MVKKTRRNRWDRMERPVLRGSSSSHLQHNRAWNRPTLERERSGFFHPLAVFFILTLSPLWLCPNLSLCCRWKPRAGRIPGHEYLWAWLLFTLKPLKTFLLGRHPTFTFTYSSFSSPFIYMTPNMKTHFYHLHTNIFSFTSKEWDISGKSNVQVT